MGLSKQNRELELTPWREGHLTAFTVSRSLRSFDTEDARDIGTYNRHVIAATEANLIIRRMIGPTKQR